MREKFLVVFLLQQNLSSYNVTLNIDSIIGAVRTLVIVGSAVLTINGAAILLALLAIKDKLQSIIELYERKPHA